MKTLNVLNLLAKGINPETGKPLPKTSIVHSAESIRLLFSIVHEFKSRAAKRSASKALIKKPETLKQTKQIKSDEERILVNINSGRPAKAGLPWNEDDITKLMDCFNLNRDVAKCAEEVQRSTHATAIMLGRVGVLSKQEVEDYKRNKKRDTK